MQDALVARPSNKNGRNIPRLPLNVLLVSQQGLQAPVKQQRNMALGSYLDRARATASKQLLDVMVLRASLHATETVLPPGQSVFEDMLYIQSKALAEKIREVEQLHIYTGLEIPEDWVVVLPPNVGLSTMKPLIEEALQSEAERLAASPPDRNFPMRHRLYHFFAWSLRNLYEDLREGVPGPRDIKDELGDPMSLRMWATQRTHEGPI